MVTVLEGVSSGFFGRIGGQFISVVSQVIRGYPFLTRCVPVVLIKVRKD